MQAQPPQEWIAWANAELGPNEAHVQIALAAAITALQNGASSDVAAAAGKIAAGRRSQHDLALLNQQLQLLSLLLRELDRLPVEADLTSESVDSVRRRWVTLDNVVRATLAGQANLLVTAPTAVQAKVDAAGPQQPGAAAALAMGAEPAPRHPLPRQSPSAPPPSAREFFADHSILILGYTGAFLLIVATVLFEIYATTQFDSTVRFAGVALLTSLFGCAGWACFKREDLVIVGRVYVALFAVLVPLTAAALYVFFELGSKGVSPNVALAFTGLASALLYALLATALRSNGYAGLSMFALAWGWVGAVRALALGGYEGTAFAPLGGVYAVVAYAWSSRVFAQRVRPFAPALIHGTAVVAFGLTLLNVSFDAPWLPLAATSGAVTIAYATYALLGRDSIPAVFALAAFGLAWLLLVTHLRLHAWSGPVVVPLALIYTIAAFRGRSLLPMLKRDRTAAWAPDSLTHASAGLAILWAVAGNLDLPEEPWTQLAITFAMLGGVYAVYCLLSRRLGMGWAIASSLSAATLFAVLALGWKERGVAASLIALAVLYGATLLALRRRMPGRLALFLEAASALQLLAVAAVLVQPDGLEALLLLLAAALAVAFAVVLKRPLWLRVFGVLFSWDWYWLVKAFGPVPPNPGRSDVALAYSPLPLLYGGAAIAVRRLTGRRWAIQLYLVAGLSALVVTGGALAVDDLHLLGVELLLYSLVLYAVAVIERQSIAAGVAIVASGVGLLSLLAAQSAPVWWYPLVLQGLAWVAWGLGEFGVRSKRNPDWVLAHRGSALAGSALVVSATFTSFGFYAAHSLEPVSALVSTLALAGLLFLFARAANLPLVSYAAGVVGSLATVWLARYFDAANPQWYVVGPGLVLVATGLLMAQDTRIPSAREWGRVAEGAGLSLLLITSAIQGAGSAPDSNLYVAVTVVESIGAMLLGIAVRHRVPVLIGAGGLGEAALRALFVVLQTLPLWVVFGAIALLLLAGAAVLATIRTQVGSAGTALRTTWQDWS